MPCVLAYSKIGILLAESHWRRSIEISVLTTNSQSRPRFYSRIYYDGIVVSIAFSNDGTTLASSSEYGIIKLWDLATGECKMTHSVTKLVDNMRFSESGSQLITNIGNINLETLPTTHAVPGAPQRSDITRSKIQGLSLSVEDGGVWIQKDSKPVLWVPQDYRSPWAYDVRGSAIALGGPSGRVLMMQFSSDLSVM